uniref:Uncharacterized protein n=1 Tax=Astatotilapia calliptera TaxID=8154 RepID=A0A3P8NNA6_ASTCA
MYSFMGGGLFCAGMENILLIVSTATDYWMQYRQSNNYMHQSLWCYCTPGKSFIHYSSFDRFDKTFAAGILFFITCFLVFLGMSMLTGVTINYYGKLSLRGGSARRRFYLSLSLSNFIMYNKPNHFFFAGIIYIYMHECPRSATSH